MTIDEILSIWAKDTEIDRTELGHASLDVPRLHHKYYKMFAQERREFRVLEEAMKELKMAKWEYYLGTLDEDSLKKYGWEPNLKKVMRSDLGLYLESDKDIIKLNLKLGDAREKVDALESILRNINMRSYQIKNAVEWTRFTQGG